MKALTFILISILFLSCGATMAVDYDKQVDFSKYISYNFFPTIDSGLGDLDERRIMKITDSLLHLRGFVKNENPQLYINFYANESLSGPRSTIGIGVGSGGGNLGIGVSGGIPIGGRLIEQQLTVDFIDVEKDELVWQAVALSEIKEQATPQQKEAYYVTIIQKILAKYPPRK